MRTVAVLPVKRFDAAKQRLRTGLTPGERRLLAEAMFSDVLIALRRASAVDAILVVSADHAVEQIASGYGIETITDAEEGHNAAAQAGVQHAMRGGADRVVLVPGDCPSLSPDEINELLAHEAPAPSVLVVPDRHGTGTNALVLTPPNAMPSSFGPGSCERHLADAAQAGVHGEVVPVTTLALDVDTADDLDALEASLGTRHGGAANTRGMFLRLQRSRSHGELPSARTEQ